MFGITLTPTIISTAYLEIPFSSLTQESGWGDTISLSNALSNVDSIDFQGKSTIDTGNIVLYVDEIEFY